jgi:hypothetical protein
MYQIDVLPDDALLEIFDFYVDTSRNPFHEHISSDERKAAIEAWQLLVHVCRRWRSLVLGSPRRLNLRLYCTPQTPIGDTLDVWPALPLVIDSRRISSEMDNIIAALGQTNRICQVDLCLAGRHFEALLAAMDVPFPELTDLRVSSFGIGLLTIPDSFLNGSCAPLQSLRLCGILFSGLPNLLFSATRLVELKLIDIPYSGYISPEEIVAPLSTLSSLKTIYLEFQSPHSHPGSGWQSRSLPLSKRSILPALDKFHFTGVSG